MVGVSGVIAGLCGYGFYQIHGGSLHGWQYLFLLNASLSIVLGGIVYWILPDSPPKATCFSEEDRKLMVERVRSNDQGIKNVKWNMSQFREALTDLYIYLLFMNTLLK